MLGLLLAGLVTVGPGVALSDAARSTRVQLISAEASSSPQVQALSREQLGIEVQRLDEARPSVARLVMLVSSGAAALIGGGAQMFWGLRAIYPSLGQSYTTGYSNFGMGLVLVVSSALAIIAGVVLEIVGAYQISRRREAGRRMEEIERQLEVPAEANRLLPPERLLIAGF